MPIEHVASVIRKWITAGHTQTELAEGSSLSPSSVGRLLDSRFHPEPETIARLVAAMAVTESALAAELLQAYLLDDVPDGKAPSGKPWMDHVSVTVAPLVGEGRSSSRVQERPADRLEEALAYLTRVARTTRHGREFVLSFYEIKHPATGSARYPKGNE